MSELFASKARNGRDGRDGRDADPELIKAIVNRVLADRPPIRGKDADPAQIQFAVERAVRELDVRNGKDGQVGPRGPEGPDGAIGPMPRHEWNGTKLRFEEAPDVWGEEVDLRGPAGQAGEAVQGGAGAGPINFSALPKADDSTPTEIMFKQGGRWVVASWDSFIAMVGGTATPSSTFADGYADGYA